MQESLPEVVTSCRPLVEMICEARSHPVRRRHSWRGVTIATPVPRGRYALGDGVFAAPRWRPASDDRRRYAGVSSAYGPESLRCAPRGTAWCWFSISIWAMTMGFPEDYGGDPAEKQISGESGWR